MDQPGPSSRTTVPQIIERPESPTGSNSSDFSTNDSNIPRLGIEIPLGIGLESSSEDEYEKPSSEEENVDNFDDNNDGPINEEPPVDYGFEDDFIGDSHFIFYSRRDVNLLRWWRAFELERRFCAGFLVPKPPIPERLNVVLRAISGINWQRAVLIGSGEGIMEQMSAAITGFSTTSPRERREFLRLFGVWANAELRAGFRDLACGVASWTSIRDSKSPLLVWVWPTPFYTASLFVHTGTLILDMHKHRF